MLFLISLWDVWQGLTREGEALLRRRHQLSLREFIVLSYLTGGDHQPSALAEALNVPRYDISRTLAQLESLGLVSRSPDPADARRSRLHLTAVGRTRQAEAEADVLALVSDRLQVLGTSPDLPSAERLSQALLAVAGPSSSLPAPYSSPSTSPKTPQENPV